MEEDEREELLQEMIADNLDILVSGEILAIADLAAARKDITRLTRKLGAEIAAFYLSVCIGGVMAAWRNTFSRQ